MAPISMRKEMRVQSKNQHSQPQQQEWSSQKQPFQRKDNSNQDQSCNDEDWMVMLLQSDNSLENEVITLTLDQYERHLQQLKKAMEDEGDDDSKKAKTHHQFSKPPQGARNTHQLHTSPTLNLKDPIEFPILKRSS